MFKTFLPEACLHAFTLQNVERRKKVLLVISMTGIKVCSEDGQVRFSNFNGLRAVINVIKFSYQNMD